MRSLGLSKYTRKPIFPHTDIHPSHRFDILMQCVTYTNHGQQMTNTVACIHPPDGSTPFTMPPERLQLLYTLFHRTQTHLPQIHQKLQAGTFGEEIYKVLTRYQEGSHCKWQTASTTTPQWSSPATLHYVIQQRTNSKRERFASPLNVSHTSDSLG